MNLRTTPLYEVHKQLGAHFTDFGGWDMPLRYGSELEEHRAVRESAGLFDLSHMGEIWVRGVDSATYLNSVLAGNLAVMAVGRAKYSLLLNDAGGIVDDLITYRLGDEEFLVVPNAGNAQTVYDAFEEIAKSYDVTLENATSTTSLVAVQGPKSAQILLELATGEEKSIISEMKYYSAARIEISGIKVLLARTGYTGEDGFELYVDNEDAINLWQAVAKAGESFGIVPAGLASRDSLRLEAGMPLYGNELGTEIQPGMANLTPVVSFKKEETFPGREAIEDATQSDRVLVGLKGLGKRAGRAGYKVTHEGKEIGEVTSGLPSPTLGYPIALAYIDRDYSKVGQQLEVDLRGKPQPYEVVNLPFYKRS